MTIRRRLYITFTAILVLFALNLIFYFYGNRMRRSVLDALVRAMQRQNLISSISQLVGDRHKEITLMAATEAASPPSLTQLEQFRTQVDSISKEIASLRDLADPDELPELDAFAKVYQELAGSWRVYYEKFGVNQARTIMEMAVHIEPLSQKIVEQMLPQIRQDEHARVEAASARSIEVVRVTDIITVIFFIASALIAVGVAFVLSHHINRGVGDLQLGAALIGMLRFDNQIPVRSKDELGQLARTFNGMSGNLLAARIALDATRKELEQRHKDVEHQKQIAESLLLNILPAQVAEELRTRNAVEPKYFEDVTILFSDFVGFSLSTEKLSAEDLVYLLHDYFSAFDEITSRYGLEKVKTIGDSYMCVGGLPVRTPSHSVDMVLAAFEMLHAVDQRNRPDRLARWSVRIGIHTGPVIAGVVGIKKFAFDIWGESVNRSSRMESCGVPGRVNISATTYNRVKDFFDCEYRGKVLTKDKQEVEMYLAHGVLPALMGGGSHSPPPAFVRRYGVYFQKQPPAFPAFLLDNATEAKAGD